jgi:NADPH2:quinone reductase
MGRFICAETPGNADVLELRDRPTPSPAAGQVTVSQTKMGLNFLDVYQTSGVYPFPENDVFVPGNEGVGKVLAVGEGVTAFKEGDRVGYPMVVGAFAEERVIAADRLVQLPDDVSDDAVAGRRYGVVPCGSWRGRSVGRAMAKSYRRHFYWNSRF